MTGLTTRQAWALTHITRCSCGSWVMLTDHQQQGTAPTTCPHLNPDALESDAA